MIKDLQNEISFLQTESTQLKNNTKVQKSMMVEMENLTAEKGENTISISTQTPGKDVVGFDSQTVVYYEHDVHYGVDFGIDCATQTVDNSGRCKRCEENDVLVKDLVDVLGEIERGMEVQNKT